MAPGRTELRARRAQLADFRFTARSQAPARDRFMIAWCHGAPGVALGRTLALHVVDDAEVRREIEVGVDTTLTRGMGRNHSLCHGDLGNLMVVERAAAVLGREDWSDQVARHTARVLAEIGRDGPDFGLSVRETVPGLFNGLAGVGLGLLYQAFPSVIPLVLGLEPPRAALDRGA